MKSLPSSGKNLIYSPVFDLVSKKVAWFNPLTSKDCPSAEKFFDQVVQGIAELSDQYCTRSVTLALKISSSVIVEQGFVDRLTVVVDRLGAKPMQLMLLLEQDILHSRVLANTILRELHHQGFTLCIDDCFAGKDSGFAALHNKYIGYLRIPSFVTKSLPSSLLALHYVRGLMSLAQQMEKKVIFQGVDTRDELQALGKIGVTYVQGNILQAYAYQQNTFRDEHEDLSIDCCDAKQPYW